MIDIDKFIVSLLNCQDFTKSEKEILHHALQDQGLRIKDAEIVSIEPKSFEVKSDEWYKCIKTYGFPHKEIFVEGKLYKTDSSGRIYDEYLRSMKLSDHKEHFRPWTIEDAKEGDVLASNRSIFIFREEYIAEKPNAYCGIMNSLFINEPGGCWTNEKCYPATKEQRDLLFSKMKEAGYEWDADEKQLKKIVQIPADLKTKAGNWYVCDMDVINENMVTAFRRGEIYYCPKDGYLDVSGALFEVGGLDVFRLATEKEIPQPKQEWSEDGWTMQDEEELQIALDTLVKAGQHSSAKWLKNVCLRPQNTWKPSEEQIEALEKECIVHSNYELCRLLEQLKKLKGK